MRGYTGKILMVDLTSRTWQEQSIPDEIYEQTLSGVGLAAYQTTREVPPGADPLGAENLLGFSAGILTGTGALFSGRWLVSGKSPLTEGWGDANCGGTFGPAIKRCGYDAIFFKGIASQPVYLYADGSSVELRDASHLWGKDATETEELLRAEAGGKRQARVACIGPAGEKLSLISGICNDRGRLAARSGLGAVMGSKRLKALVLAGRQAVRPADGDELKRLSKTCSKYVPADNFRFPAWVFPPIYRLVSASKTLMRQDGLLVQGVMGKWGTPGVTQVCLVVGDTPVKNWSGSAKDYPMRAVNPDIYLRHGASKYHCSACPLGCGAILRMNGEGETHRPEYETTASFGTMLLNTDLDSVMTVNELLNRAGMDTISAGSTVAFAIECFENGLLTETDTGGLRLRWGEPASIVELVKRMIAREGIGDLLADGVKVAATKIGRGAEKYAVHAGGQELPMHDPKCDTNYGVHYIAEPTPGRHTIGSIGGYESLRLWTRVSWAPEAPRFYPESRRYAPSQELGVYAAACSMAKMLLDGAGLCFFGTFMGVDRFPLFEYLNAATGWQKTPEEYMEIGKRVQTLRQRFNIREGVLPTEVEMNIRGYAQALKDGATKGRTVNIEAMRAFYWQAMGWDKNTGFPL